MFRKNNIKKAGLVFISLILMCIPVVSAQIKVTIQAGQPGVRISPTMYGIFFEDINFGADGGLYSELIKNRSFEFPDPMMGWSKLQREGAEGTLSIRDDDAFISGKAYGQPGNENYLRIEAVSYTHLRAHET